MAIATLAFTRDAVTEHVQLVSLSCDTYSLAARFNVTAVTQITSTAGAAASRRWVSVFNGSQFDSIAIGFSAAVTAGTGYLLPPGGSKEYPLGAALTLWAISTSANSCDVSVMELG